METIISLLHALGIDQTIWAQLAFFLVTFAVLNWLVFKPYLRAFDQRAKNTFGSETAAKELLEETDKLQKLYEQTARRINDKIREVYDRAKTNAQESQNKILDLARDESTELIKRSRAQIRAEVQIAKTSLQPEVKTISHLISNKLIGKEMAE